MDKRVSRIFAAVVLVPAALFLLTLAAASPAAGQASVLKLNALTAAQARGVGVRNVIVMIPDGMGSTHATVGRWYKYAKTGVNRLSFDDLACGMVRTYWSTGLITDSAPAASAMATGYKTSYGYIGLRPARSAMPDLPELLKGDESTPVATVLEAARLQGRSTGLVVTCEFPHATPAGFSAHYVQRNAMELLAEQQVYLGMDVVLGGGRRYLDPAARKDKEDLVKVLRDRGYSYVTDRASLLATKPSKLWGAFAATGMERDLDRDPRVEPSLAEMTQKALEILDRNRKGFFLMVEGSQVEGKIVLFQKGHSHRHAARHADHGLVGGEARVRVDHLVPGFDQGQGREEKCRFCTGTHHHFLGGDGNAAAAAAVLGDHLPQGRHSRWRGVARAPFRDGPDARQADI